MRERMADLDEAGRERMRERMAAAYGAMDDHTRTQMLKHVGLRQI